MHYIDALINKISMYRLVSIGLLIVALIAVIFGFTGTLTLSGSQLLVSLLTVMVSGIIADQLFSRLYGFASNEGSSMVTALIIFFLFFPPSDISEVAVLALGTFLAIASKYLIVYKKRHIFNPAAFGAVALGVAGLAHATWWIGSTVMLPFIALLGFLILGKLHRFTLFTAFFITAVVITIFRDFDSQSIHQIATDAIASSPLLFLGTIMLTEPSTLPVVKKFQYIYAVLVGALYALPLPYVTPEIALVIGNAFAYAASPQLRSRSVLRLKRANRLSDSVTEYVFSADRTVSHEPGQYVDLTLPVMAMDFRGNRRTFTLASSPTEKDIIITTRNSASKFKTILSKAKPGSRIFGDGPAGNFTLPTDTEQGMVWIAGGIGVTPFRSMAKFMIDAQQDRTVDLFYVSSGKDFVYKDIFDRANKNGIRVNYIADRVTCNAALIAETVPQYQNRIYYISGPDAMVRHYKKLLIGLNISQKNIITDYFSGY